MWRRSARLTTASATRAKQSLCPALRVPKSRHLATVTCAPSNNLNDMFPRFATAAELYSHIRALSKNESKEFVVRNFVGVIEDVSVAASTVETELFPKGALDYYTKKNMVYNPATNEWRPKDQSEMRATSTASGGGGATASAEGNRYEKRMRKKQKQAEKKRR